MKWSAFLSHINPTRWFISPQRKPIIPIHQSTPNEFLLDIFKYLPYEELNRIRKVDRQWKKVIEQSQNFLSLYLFKDGVFFDYDLTKIYIKKPPKFKKVHINGPEGIFPNLHICVLKHLDIKNMNQHSYEVIQKWSQKFGGKIKIKTLSLNFFDVDLPPKDLLEYFDLNGSKLILHLYTNNLASSYFLQLLRIPCISRLDFHIYDSNESTYFSTKEVLDFITDQESFENRTNFLAKGQVEEDFIEKLLTTFQNVAYPGKFFKSIKIEASTERSNQWIDVLKSFGIILTKENIKDKEIKLDLRLHHIDDKRFIQVGEIKRSDDWVMEFMHITLNLSDLYDVYVWLIQISKKT